MESPRHRITFKILAGYIILGILAIISGVLIISEIKNFTEIQKQDVFDRSKIVKAGSLIASIYENENLSRSALQSNSIKQHQQYTDENEQLLLKIDSLNFSIDNAYQKNILDSIKLIIDEKVKNILALKRLKLRDTSEKSIHTAINKLSSIDSILGKISITDSDKIFITDFVDNIEFFDKKTPSNLYLKDYAKMLDKLNPSESDHKINPTEIDSLLTISKKILNNAQTQKEYQRKRLERKERELIENDVLISKKLRELLHVLENDIIKNTKSINKQREESIERSKKIILFAAGISLVIIIIFSIIFLNDFWKSERYRKKLEEANNVTSALLKSREQIVSMVSHDLRTPLSTITGYTELLQKSINNSKENNYIEHIKSASAYMEQLVNDLLEFSNIENNNISIACVPFDLEKLLNEVVKHVESSVKEKPIVFAIDLDKSINHAIISDPFRVKQILYNLVINAYKFTDQGSITIKSNLDREKNILHLSVIDTGIGIDKEHQKNIFKAFTQAGNAKSNKQNGFGLGLTISKKLSELLGGNLILESTLGTGSTFTLSVPVVLSDEILNKKEVLKPQLLFNIKVLVVEDDVSMRQLLGELLKQYGIESYIFENAHKALEALDTLEYDLVLTDIQLPKMNGIRFMEILKQHNSYKNQPIIAMTGRLNLSVKDYLESGFSKVLIKPFNTSKLENVFQQFFKANSLKTTNSKETNVKQPKGFSITTLSLFLNNDGDSIKNTLTVFFKDVQQNKKLLDKAIEEHDLDLLNDVSHKMLSMFKQLEVQAVIPFLEMFETTTKIDMPLFIAFEKVLNKFLKDLEEYLS